MPNAAGVQLAVHCLVQAAVRSGAEAGEGLQGGLQRAAGSSAAPGPTVSVQCHACSHPQLCCNLGARRCTTSRALFPFLKLLLLSSALCSARKWVCISRKCGFWVQCSGVAGRFCLLVTSRCFHLPTASYSCTVRPLGSPLCSVSVSHFLRCCWIKRIVAAISGDGRRSRTQKRPFSPVSRLSDGPCAPPCHSVGRSRDRIRDRPTLRSSCSKTSLRVRARRRHPGGAQRSAAFPVPGPHRGAAPDGSRQRGAPCGCSSASHVLLLIGTRCSLPQRRAVPCLTAAQGRLTAVRSSRGSPAVIAVRGPSRRQSGRWDRGAAPRLTVGLLVGCSACSSELLRRHRALCQLCLLFVLRERRRGFTPILRHTEPFAL